MNKKAIVIIVSAVVLSAAFCGCDTLGSVSVNPDDPDQFTRAAQQVRYTVAEETQITDTETERTVPSVFTDNFQTTVISESSEVSVTDADNQAVSQETRAPELQYKEETKHSENTEKETETEKKETVSEPQKTSAPETQSVRQETYTEAPVTEKPAEQVSEVSLKYADGILIVNKSYPVPEGYRPDNMVVVPGSNQEYLLPETADAFSEMCSAAWQQGLTLWVQSGFRSYELQTRLYNNYVAANGKTAADTFSARPGYSEHHTGLALDLNTITDSFANTAEGKWVAENCWKYGFIIRYPKDKENITGYKYEPWHLRYLGKDLAKDIYDSGLCLEEYFGLTSCYSN